MKISDEEISAAIAAFDDARARSPLWDSMGVAIEAAYTVRKARKAAKRAKAKPDQEAATSKALQPVRRFKVGDKVSNIAPIGAFDANAHGTVVSAESGQYRDGCYFVRFDDEYIRAGYLGATTTWLIHGSYLDIVSEPEPAAPAWNGKFEVGKVYRTRDGRKAEIIKRTEDSTFPINGIIEGEYVIARLSWREDGRYSCDVPEHPCDLVGHWED